MSEGRRVARVEIEIQRCAAEYLIRHMQSELNVIITVSRVQVTKDLRIARVYVTALGSVIEWKSILKHLQLEAGEIQAHLVKSLRMKYCPKLEFYRDESIEKVLKVDGLIRQIQENKKS